MFEIYNTILVLVEIYNTILALVEIYNTILVLVEDNLCRCFIAQNLLPFFIKRNNIRAMIRIITKFERDLCIMVNIAA